MYSVKTYKDLSIEIEISKIRIEGLKSEKRLLEVGLKPPGELKAMEYSDMPKGNNSCISLERLLPRINKIDIALEREELIFNSKSKELLNMNIKLKELTGIQYQVCKLKEIDGLNIFQIAERLNKSTRTVDRIIALIYKTK